MEKTEFLVKNMIGYEASHLGDVTFESFNPLLDKENLWEFKQATEEEVDKAVQKANKAYPIFSRLPGYKRADFLEAIAKRMENNAKNIVETYVVESGLPMGRGEGELKRTIGQIQRFANIARTGSWNKPIIDKSENADIRKANMAMGTVVVFGASNFPLAFSTAGGDTASALAVGCPVIVKAHPLHGATSGLVAEAIIGAAKETNMPEGVFSHLFDVDHAVGRSLVRHPGVSAVGFTGSFKGGILLNRMAQQRDVPIPVFAEMGSINPVVVLPEIEGDYAEIWASRLAESVNTGAGQFCTNPGLILGVEGRPFMKFVGNLAISLSRQRPSCMLSPKMLENYINKVEMMEAEGVSLLLDFKTTKRPNIAFPILAQVSGKTFMENKDLHEEVFGPFTLVVTCSSIEELNEVILNLDGQLTGTVLGEYDNLDPYSEVIANLQEKVGRLIFNGVPTGVEVCGAMHHGGPYPATTDARFTSVGDDACLRWVRPVAFQNWPDALLPESLQHKNPLNLIRKVNGEYSSKRV